MSAGPMQDGLHIVTDDGPLDGDRDDGPDGLGPTDATAQGELGQLRDAFVEAFNNRDIEAMLATVRPDVECPDFPEAEGTEALVGEVEAIWERSPEAFLTRGHLDDLPIAVAWRPDEDGRWIRVALVCFDEADGLLSVVELPDDVDSLERAEVEEPVAAEIDEWADWGEWDRGEETVAPDPDRRRP